MSQSQERRFLTTVSGFLVSLPFDLKVLFEAKDDPDLDRKARELACGAILYVLTPGDVAGEKNIIGFVDDVIIVRLALKHILDQGGDGAQAFRNRFAEQYASLDETLACFSEFLGPDLYGWLASKLDYGIALAPRGRGRPRPRENAYATLVGRPGGTPRELAGEDACATAAKKTKKIECR